MINKSVLIHCVRLSIATFVAAIFGKIFNVGHMYWLMFTVVLVIQGEIGSSIKRSAQRFIGTLIGAPIGLIIIALVGSYHVALLAIVAVALFILMLLFAPKAYGVAAIFITAAVMVVYAITGDTQMTQTAISRIFDTSLGTVIAIVVSLTIFPVSLDKVIENDWSKFLRLSGDAYVNITHAFVDIDEQRYSIDKLHYFDSANGLIKKISEYSWEPTLLWGAKKDNRELIINTTMQLLNKYVELSALINSDVALDEDVKNRLIALSLKVKNAFYELADKKPQSENLSEAFAKELNFALEQTKKTEDKKIQWRQIVKTSAFFELSQGVIETIDIKP
ncbi:MAG: hypothetical protein RL154_334 [Pseudomonadota bacterium]|jgi:hypothetical protein